MKQSSTERPSAGTNAIQLPAWFLHNCVQTSAELRSSDVPLVVRDLPPETAASSTSETLGSDSEATCFEIDVVIYEALNTVLSRLRTSSDPNPHMTHYAEFSKKNVFLSVPNRRYGRGCPDFLGSIVKYFAKDIGADMITLCLEDVEDLAQHFLSSEGRARASAEDNIRHYFQPEDQPRPEPKGPKARIRNIANRWRKRPKVTSEQLMATTEKPKAEFPFSIMLDAPLQKLSDGDSARDQPQALVIHIPNAHLFDSYYDVRRNILPALSQAIFKKSSNKGRVLLVYSSHFSRELRSLRDETNEPEVLPMIPLKSPVQMRLIEKGLPSSRYIENRNIRALQRQLRQFTENPNKLLTDPYAESKFLEDSGASRILKERVLELDEIQHLAEMISTDIDPDRIKEILLRGERRRNLLLDWGESLRESPWDGFPPKVQDAILEIEKDENREWEQKLLELLVSPEAVDEGWSDIELDPDIKEALQQILSQSSGNSASAYGVLKRGRVNGAVLYGPPGTGKTHLARVVAHECHATMISATAADLNSKWVGETEKGIQALFNLGRLLAPSVIFIDEADTLFRGRSDEDHSWERASINQFLSEMDDLVRSKDAPFVLLATNFPQTLDHAVLRRVPCRLHIGLPRLQARKRIFEIVLREEKLDDSLVLDDLARKTQGFSGSDIKTVCIQAALICEASRDDATKSQGVVRSLKRIHFTQALQRCAPTVTRKALKLIREWASDHDPLTWEKMMTEKDMDGVVHDAPFTPTESSQPDTPQKVPRTEENPQGPSEPMAAEDDPHLEYSPLKPGSKQIRVLSIDARPWINNASSLETIHCTLETVDIDDRTDLYRKFFEGVEGEDQYLDKLSAWYYVCSLQDPIEDRDTTWHSLKRLNRAARDISHSSFQIDAPIEALSELKPRYNWGDYLALSYVWGDTTQKEHIVINGRKFPVGRNLHLALRRLCQSAEIQKRQLKVWIDAICINQNDITERETEVKKMAMIYSEALAVRAWVGHPPSSTGTGPHLTSASTWLDPSVNLDDGLSRARTWLDQVQHQFGADGKHIESFWSLGPDSRDSIMAAALSLLQSPYWQRLWIVREIALAASLVYWYGQWHFTGLEIATLHTVLSDVRKRLIGPVGRSQPVVKPVLDLADDLIMTPPDVMSRLSLRLDKLTWNRGLFKHLSLDTIVEIAQLSRATDERDKVYGVLSLLPETIRVHIQPNYGPDFNAWQAYVMFSKACIIAEGNINALCRAATAHLQRNPLLPSWAFDLSAPQIATGISFQRRYNANGNLEVHPTFFDNDQVMYCQGILVDEILNVGRSFNPKSERAGKEGAHVETTHNSQSDSMNGNDEVPREESQAPHLPPPVVGDDERLALERVLRLDSNYEFAKEPSLLNIPWQPQQHGRSSSESAAAQDYVQEQWEDLPANPNSRSGPWMLDLIQTVLRGNAAFPVYDGVPLEQYFTASSPSLLPAGDWATNELPSPIVCRDVAVNFKEHCLCSTEGGLVGMVPERARIGDKVAVLFSCDMPVILRPRENGYEFVGGCFVEGLMKGEAVAAVEEGMFQTNTIAIL